MKNSRINFLADFFYSSNTSLEVPCRISLSFGMGGIDLSKPELIEFLMILNKSENIKTDLDNFVARISNEK